MLVTNTGRKFDFTNINAESIYIPDILSALPKLNRFVGHSERAYSVGEHTLYGFYLTEKLGFTPLERLYWFIHDFTEAYVGDCPAPLKALLPEFSKIEAEVEWAILKKLGLPVLSDEDYKKVKSIDLTMLVIEMRDLTSHNHEEFIESNPDYVVKDLVDNYNISKREQDIVTLEEMLTEAFDTLIKEVKGEDFNWLEI